MFKGRCEYKQFVENRVKQIQANPEITWHHIPTKKNPADLGSRLGPRKPTVICSGEERFGFATKVSGLQSMRQNLKANQAEAKVIKDLLCTVAVSSDRFDELFEKYSLRKVVRIGAWIARFT